MKLEYIMAIQKDGYNGYKFLCFDTYNDFAYYHNKTPTLVPKDDENITNRYSDYIATPCPSISTHHYEVISGEQCPYFDFDGSISNLDELVNTIRYMVKDIPICINMYNSNGKTKQSYHIVVKGIYLKDHLCCAEFTKRVISKCKIPSYDAGVYTSKRNLRLLGSRKLNDNRTKVFDTCLYKSDNFVSKHINDELYMSLVSTTNDSILFDIDIPRLREVYTNTDSINISDVATIIESMYPSVFSVGNVTNGIVTLRRLKPHYCDICNRKHDKSDAFVTITNSKLYFRCYRDPKGTPIELQDQEEEVEIDVVTTEQVNILEQYVDKLKRLYKFN